MSPGTPSRPPATQPAYGSPEFVARQLEKSLKINAALMQRVERSMDQPANAYALFQTAIGLETQVRARTEELNSVLGRLEATNSDLIDARDAAERATSAKTRFFTAVGHDVLQPLHAARLCLAALDGTVRPLVRDRLVGQIDHALSSIEELLGSILDISKLEAGLLRPKVQAVALGPLMASVAADLEPVARAKGIEIIARATRLGAISDRQMLRRILQNLTANAVRYTAAGGVRLLARRRDGRVVIEVWDSGPGIAPAERERIFEEFQRGAAAEQAGGGFGLGLSIVRRMADALGHEIGLCSKLGHGTCFRIKAPLAATGTLAPDPEDAPAFSSGIAAYGFNGARIAVIDNDEAVLKGMQALLDGWGCRGVFARTPSDIETALTLLIGSGTGVDLVLADYHLAGGALGTDAIARIRRASGRDVPAIIITADQGSEPAEAAKRAGCLILRKPVKPAEIRALMQHILRPAV